MNKILFIALLVCGSASAADCPWEKPYKCRVVAYSTYQCGCGVEWSQNRVGQNSQNPYLPVFTPPTVIVNQPYSPPRYIRYDGSYNMYKVK